MQAPNERKLEEILRAVLALAPGVAVTDVRQQAEAGWDSLAHAMLVAALESEFSLQIDAGDSLELTSYQAISSYLEARGL